MFSRQQLDRYHKDGFVVVDDIVDPNMMEKLLKASRRVKQRVRLNEVDLFTHWASPGDPWAIRGLFAPEFGEKDFAAYLLSDPVMGYVRPVLGNELQLGGVLLFTNPHNNDYGFGWHRDSIRTKAEMSEKQELELLDPEGPINSLVWHLALVDDACLMVVPGSQLRFRTEQELRCLTDTRHEDLLGQHEILLNAGQAVFWNNKIIHRGVIKKDVERLTLSCVWEKYVKGGTPKEVDARVRWQLESGVRNSLPEGMLVPYDRWRALQID